MLPILKVIPFVNFLSLLAISLLFLHTEPWSLGRIPPTQTKYHAGPAFAVYFFPLQNSSFSKQILSNGRCPDLCTGRYLSILHMP